MVNKWVVVKWPEGGQKVMYLVEVFADLGCAIGLWRWSGSFNAALVPLAACSVKIPRDMQRFYNPDDSLSFRHWWRQHSELVVNDFCSWLEVAFRSSKGG